MTSTITGMPSSQPKNICPSRFSLGNGCMQDRRPHARAAWQYPERENGCMCGVEHMSASGPGRGRIGISMRVVNGQCIVVWAGR
jgi:hypothetical protein